MTPSFRRVSARNFVEKLRESSRCFSASFRGVSPHNLAEKKVVCANLREILQSFLRKSSRLRIFVCGVNTKKELLSWADLYMVWPGSHGMVYVMAWRSMAWYMVWPGGHGMGKGLAWRAWRSIWIGLTMVYGIAWRAWHGI